MAADVECGSINTSSNISPHERLCPQSPSTNRIDYPQPRTDSIISNADSSRLNGPSFASSNPAAKVLKIFTASNQGRSSVISTAHQDQIQSPNLEWPTSKTNSQISVNALSSATDCDSPLSPRTKQVRPELGEKRRTSFLNKLIGSKRKTYQAVLRRDSSSGNDHQSSIINNESTGDLCRPEAKDAEIFSPVLEPSEFGPYLQKPGYVKVRVRSSQKRRFDSIFLAQVLEESDSGAGDGVPRRKGSTSGRVIQAVEFSKDGRYLATAGDDAVIKIWEVITSQSDRWLEMDRRRSSTSPNTTTDNRPIASVFKSKPIREYTGHSSSVVDITWSRNNFLLSSSRDNTVRLWHLSRHECLCTFKHSEFVTSIAFHPTDDNLFLTGSLDNKLRLWSIAEKKVSLWTKLPEKVTAVAFTPDGKYAVAGGNNGLVMSFDTERLRYHTQMRVDPSTSLKQGKNNNITAIQTFKRSSNSETKLLITSGDSRVRIYNFRNKLLEIKFKGCQNTSSNIKASLSDDQRFVSCGSEDNQANIWCLDTPNKENKLRKPLEHFQAHDSIVTCVRIAPRRTRWLLSQSSDPIYDLCNPRPPAKITMSGGLNSGSSSSTALDSISTNICSGQDRRESLPPTAYNHDCGSIIITASVDGSIKVFRQDCGAEHRPRNSDSKKLGRRISSLALSSASSFRTRSYNSCYFSTFNYNTIRRESAESHNDRHVSNNNDDGADQILNWQYDIQLDPCSAAQTPTLRSTASSRSLSPRKSSSQTFRSSAASPRPSVTSTSVHTSTSTVDGIHTLTS